MESGGPPPPESFVPAFNIALLEGEADWNFRTVPQRFSHRAYQDHVSAVRTVSIIPPSRFFIIIFSPEHCNHTKISETKTK